MTRSVGFSALPVLALGAIALAQGQPSPGPNTREQQPGLRDLRRDDARGTERDFNALSMSKVVNARVTNTQGEDVGTIKDIAFDSRRGRAAYALVSSREDGSDQLYVVPWNSIKARGDGSVALTTPGGRLLPASRFNERDWSLLGDRTFGTELHRAYGQQPYWDNDADAVRRGGLDRDGAGTSGREGPDRDGDAGREPSGITGRDRDRDIRPGRESGGTGRRDVDSSSITLLRGSELRGQRITNRQNEAIGSINDLVIDANTGRVAYPLVSVGDYLGTRDDQVPIPWQQIQFGERGAMTSDLSRDLLRDAPRMDRTNPPRSSDRDFVNRVYQYYGHDPFLGNDQNKRTDAQEGADAQRQDDRTDQPRRDQGAPADRGDATGPENRNRDRDRGGDDRP